MNKKAFTLLELLMVVIIIGILATFAMPQYEKLREKAIAARAVSILSQAVRAKTMLGKPALNDHEDLDMHYWTSWLTVSKLVSGKLYWFGAASRKDGPYKDLGISFYYEDGNLSKPRWEGNHPYTPGGPTN